MVHEPGNSPAKEILMRLWKAALGMGVACAVCCAAPIAGAIGALAAGATTLAAAGAALLPCADEAISLALVLLALAAASGGVAWWRLRRRQRLQVASPCEGACDAGR
jgi:hypothetical protein